jgi:phage-related minor tail protein
VNRVDTLRVRYEVSDQGKVEASFSQVSGLANRLGDNLGKVSEQARKAGEDVGKLDFKTLSPQQLFAMNRSLAAFRDRGKEVGLTAREMRYALRGVPAQFTDIVTSIASGQRPIQVLLQQGGQLKDMFGGTGAAVRALGGYLVSMVNPLTIAAGAVGLLTLAWKQSANEADAFNKAIILTGNHAGVSAKDLEDMADRLAAATSVSTGVAREAITQATATGRFTKEQIESVARAALEMKQATGAAVEATIQQFVRIADDPVRAIEALNKTQHLLSESTAEQISQLQDQGKEAEAAALAIQGVADATLDRADDVETHLSAWATIWHDIASGASTAFDAIGRGIANADTAAAQAKSLLQVLTTISPTLGAAAAGYLGTVNARTAKGDFSNVQGSVSTIAADYAKYRGLPADFGLGVEPPKSGGSDGDGSGNPRAQGLRDVAAAAREADKALADFNRTEIQREQDFISGLKTQAQAGAQFQAIVAQLSGPDASAKFAYDQQIEEIQRLGAAAGKTAQEIADAQALVQSPEQQEAAERVRQVLDEQARIMSGVQYAAEDMFASFIDGSKSAADAFGDFARDVQRIAARMLAERAVEALFGMFLGGGAPPSGGSGFGNNTGWLTDGSLGGNGGAGFSLAANAKGGTYNSPSLHRYVNGVYDKPQFFAFAKGGVFAEDGDEAVMPLERGPGGTLGVHNFGGGAGDVEIVVNVNNNGESVTARQTGVRRDGDKVILDLVLDRVAGEMQRRGTNLNTAVHNVIRSRTGAPVSGG